MKVRLESLLAEVVEKTTENNQHPVLTSSKSGLYLQSDYFNKQVASKDNTGYKIIRRGQFTYRAMSDTGEFYPNILECADIGIVSPAYPVFEITDTNALVPEYLKYYFKSGAFQHAISSFAQGSTRTSIKFDKMKTVTSQKASSIIAHSIKINMIAAIAIITCRIRSKTVPAKIQPRWRHSHPERKMRRGIMRNKRYLCFFKIWVLSVMVTG